MHTFTMDSLTYRMTAQLLNSTQYRLLKYNLETNKLV